MQRQLHTIFALTAVIWVICQSVNYSILKGFRKTTVIIQIGVGGGGGGTFLKPKFRHSFPANKKLTEDLENLLGKWE